MWVSAKVGEALVGLDLGERHRPLQLLDRHEIDDVRLAGRVGGIGIGVAVAALAMPTTAFSSPVW